MKDYLTENKIKECFLENLPSVDFSSLRFMEEKTETLSIRKDILETCSTGEDRGIMITLVDKGSTGYGATASLTESGIRSGIANAMTALEINRKYPLIDYTNVEFSHHIGERREYEKIPWSSIPLSEKIEFLKEHCHRLKISDSIIERQIMLCQKTMKSRYITSGGGDFIQSFCYVIPRVLVLANKSLETQQRSLGGLMDWSRQGGWEIVKSLNLEKEGIKIAEEALILLDAPNCPSGKMDLLLDSGQMMLQVHESVGHPLEIDRILGDERNYAGTSFVTADMFGTYQYGSPLMNITFDPTIQNQLASYSLDDEGEKTEKKFIIKDGILKRGLGSIISQNRSGIPGVANARSTSWNRPPIDRMANLNLEPGESSFEDMISSVDKGVYMRTNLSWSIDDSRNKFQFGCEWGQLIENGRLTIPVKNPNYRGISAVFWRNLMKVGNLNTFHVMGIPSCGKGEPNQMIRVGHAAPSCLFSGVEVFGGEIS